MLVGAVTEHPVRVAGTSRAMGHRIDGPAQIVTRMWDTSWLTPPRTCPKGARTVSCRNSIASVVTTSPAIRFGIPGG